MGEKNKPQSRLAMQTCKTKNMKNVRSVKEARNDNDERCAFEVTWFASSDDQCQKMRESKSCDQQLVEELEDSATDNFSPKFVVNIKQSKSSKQNENARDERNNKQNNERN